MRLRATVFLLGVLASCSTMAQPGPWLEAMAGVLYNEDDMRNDNLDSPLYSGPFVKVLSNDIKIRDEEIL
jgi:hypothetical protein